MTEEKETIVIQCECQEWFMGMEDYVDHKIDKECELDNG